MLRKENDTLKQDNRLLREKINNLNFDIESIQNKSKGGT